MQERSGESFVIATANDASKLPPELLRKGRFDEVWWIDLPTAAERAEIIQATLTQYKRDFLAVIPTAQDMRRFEDATVGFTGSEIANLVPDALYAAFAENEREIVVDDLLNAAKTVVPLGRTAKEKIDRLRDWAAGRARPASNVAAVSQVEAPKLRVLDL